MTVAEPSAAYLSMVKGWKKLRTLEAGTGAMRASGETYLMRNGAEDDADYLRRLEASVLFNMVKRARSSLAGKVFARPITFNNMPDDLIEWSKNIDFMSSDHNQFSKVVFQDALVAGMSHILVDFPALDPGISLGEEQEIAARPYFIHKPAESVIGARSMVVDGREILMQVRLFESTLVPFEEFGEASVERIRVIEKVDQFDPNSAVHIRLFEEQDGNWEEIAEPRLISLPNIPFVTIYMDRTGFMTSNLPLEDLADKNIEHWNSSSDQRHISRFSRFPMFSATGVTEEEEQELVVGPNSLLISAEPQASFQIIETSGAAIAAGRQDLEDLKVEMQQLAMEPLTQRSGNAVATARVLDSAEANCALSAFAFSLQDGLNTAYSLMGQWIGEEAGTVNVNNEFGMGFKETAELDALISMHGMGLLSSDSLWAEMKRRDVLMESFDPDQEKELIENEGPALGTIPPLPEEIVEEDEAV